MRVESALAVAPCECVLVAANPLRRLCRLKRSRRGAARISSWSRRTLCGDRASKRSRCGAVQIFSRPLLVERPLEVISWSGLKWAVAGSIALCSAAAPARKSISSNTKAKSMRKLCSRSSGGSNFERRSSLRSAFPQLRLESHASSGQVGRSIQAQDGNSTDMQLSSTRET